MVEQEPKNVRYGVGWAMSLVYPEKPLTPVLITLKEGEALPVFTTEQLAEDVDTARTTRKIMDCIEDGTIKVQQEEQ